MGDEMALHSAGCTRVHYNWFQQQQHSYRIFPLFSFPQLSWPGDGFPGITPTILPSNWFLLRWVENLKAQLPKQAAHQSEQCRRHNRLLLMAVLEASTPHRGHSSSQEASSSIHKGIHQEEESVTAARCTFHVRAGPSPRCNLVYAWLLEVESS